MMKRILCMALALVLALGAAACGSRPMQKAEETVESLIPDMTPEVPASAAPETAMPSATPTMESSLTTRDVLDSIRDVDPDAMDNPVATYLAAARVLTFCEAGGPTKADFAQDVRDYFADMDDDRRATFEKSARSVLELAQRIAKGDVEQDELERNLADADDDWRNIDPVTFQHENLKTFVDALTAQR